MEEHDQTRGESAPQIKDARAAALSCNEVASLCMKAARGSGMSWGMAEEAGFAASWLASHGVDGPSHMRAHLQRSDGRAWAELCPNVTPQTWQNARGHAMCPIALGAALCDYAGLPEGPKPGCEIALGRVSEPILLLPFLFEVACGNELTFTLTWTNGEARIDDRETWLAEAVQGLAASELALTLRARAAQPFRPCASAIANAHTTADSVAALNALAMRTTVPASDASRAGAGSALSDND